MLPQALSDFSACFPEWEQCAESQGSWNDTASLEQLVQKSDKEKPIRLLHSSRGREMGLFLIQHWNPSAAELFCQALINIWEHTGMFNLAAEEQFGMKKAVLGLKAAPG